MVNWKQRTPRGKLRIIAGFAPHGFFILVHSLFSLLADISGALLKEIEEWEFNEGNFR
jgi:hypothetical protein